MQCIGKQDAFYSEWGKEVLYSDRYCDDCKRTKESGTCQKTYGTCDGIYLFGDLSALDFYRKLGLEERMQYRYRLKDNVRTDMLGRNLTEEHRNGFVKLDSSDEKSKEAYCEAVEKSVARKTVFSNIFTCVRIIDSYRLTQTEDEILVTEKVNNLFNRKSYTLRHMKKWE